MALLRKSAVAVGVADMLEARGGFDADATLDDVDLVLVLLYLAHPPSFLLRTKSVNQDEQRARASKVQGGSLTWRLS